MKSLNKRNILVGGIATLTLLSSTEATMAMPSREPQARPTSTSSSTPNQVRDRMEKLNYNVNYNDRTQTYTAHKNGNTYEFSQDCSTFKVNNKDCNINSSNSDVQDILVSLGCNPSSGSSSNSSSSSGNSTSSGNVSDIDAYALEVLDLVNVERAKYGLSPLQFHEGAFEAAQVRAVELEKSFSHTRPNGSSCFTALNEAGVSFRGAGENVAIGQQTPEQVVQAWMNSEGHRANILKDSYTHLGVGVYKTSSGQMAWAQLFITQ